LTQLKVQAATQTRIDKFSKIPSFLFCRGVCHPQTMKQSCMT
jgi:hypothetical protein